MSACSECKGQLGDDGYCEFCGDYMLPGRWVPDPWTEDEVVMYLRGALVMGLVAGFVLTAMLAVIWYRVTS